MKVTIGDVAKKAGVSRATVSRVLNQNYHYISDETRERVLRAIEEMDYRPNALAKGLKQMKTNMLGVVLSNLQNPFWSKVMEGIEDTCQNYGYSLLIANSREDMEKEIENMKSFMERQVDGIIVNPTREENPFFQTLIERNFPVLFMNRKVKNGFANMVLMNNIRGAYLGVEHLVKLGKRNIALFIYPPQGVSPRLERIEGYKSAMSMHKLEVQPSWIRIVRNKEECKNELRDLFQNSRVDAIFSTNSVLTLQIFEVLKELAYKVPQDVAVLGYDETEWAKHLDPPLTTVQQPAYEMGRVSAERLIQMIRGEQSAEPSTILLEPTLIVRQSCGETTSSA
jgi:LacI family kdg operon repressor/LacI family transcriptional regulator